MAIEAAKLQVTVESNALKVSGELKTLGSQIQKTGTEGSKNIGTLTKGFQSWQANVLPAMAIVGGGIVTVKKMMDFSAEGANLLFLQDKFNRMATSIGSDGDSLKAKLDGVTRGMMSNTEEMGLAVNLISLGLAKTEDQAVRLSHVAAGLGMDVGELVLALTNQTTRRFDQLGVRVDGFADRLKALKATGMDTNEAFKEAFLQQAEEQLTLVGEKADSAAAAMTRYNTNMTNLIDNTKLWVATNTDLGAALNTILFGSKELTNAFEQHRAEIATMDMTYQEYVLELIRSAEVAGVVAKGTYEWLLINKDNTTALEQGAKAVGAMTAEERRMAIAEERVATEDTSERLEQLKRHMEGVGTAARDVNAEFERLQTIIGGSVGQIEADFTEKSADLAKQKQEILAQMKEAGAPETLDPGAQDKIDEQQNALIGFHNQLKDLADQAEADYKKLLGGEGLEELDSKTKKSVEGLRGQIWTTIEAIKELGGQPYATPEQEKQLEDLRGQLSEVEAQQKAIAAERDKAMGQAVYDQLQKQAEADNEITEKELENLTRVAEKLGLIDQATADMYDKLGRVSMDTTGWDFIDRVISDITGLPTEKEINLKLTMAQEGLPADIQQLIMGETQQPITDIPVEVGGADKVKADLDEIKQKVEAIPATPSVTISDNSSDVQGHIAKLGGALAALPTEKTIYINVVTTGDLGMLGTFAPYEEPVPGKASGGTVSPNRPYVVGENGPEIFSPAGYGNIIPNDKLNGAGMGSTFNIMAPLTIVTQYPLESPQFERQVRDYLRSP